jgi:hypothetical protein
MSDTDTDGSASGTEAQENPGEELPESFREQLPDEIPVAVLRAFIPELLDDRARDVFEGLVEEQDVDRLIEVLLAALKAPSRWKSPNDGESRAVLTAVLCQLSNHPREGPPGAGGSVNLTLTGWLIDQVSDPLEVVSGCEDVSQILKGAFPTGSVDGLDPQSNDMLHGKLDEIDAEFLARELRIAVREPEFSELRAAFEAILYQLS